MFIQEIIIDGFKSYAHRTVVTGFDPHFNAITGLNGSGKSNILDAICFVLGITNLSQVRAGNLSELVYKQGQAGVTKATVSIVFDNSDPSLSPFGFEQSPDITVTRHVLLGGKSKYTINGRSVPASTVHNLFRSVQLNVNNPHFLIMQGRITKVLNMRSHEILGMVEEAAGTKLYQDKRASCLKTLERKEQKVNEIQTIVQEDIAPTLERLQGEKQNYLKWSKNAADVERLERLCVAYQFYTAQHALHSHHEGGAELQTTVETLERDEQSYREQLQTKQQSMTQAMSVMNGTLEAELATTKQTEQEHARTLVRDTAQWKSRQASVVQAQTDLTTAQTYVHETEQAIRDKETELEHMTKNSTTSGGDATCVVQDAEQAAQTLAQLQHDYTQRSAGLTHQSLPAQIRQALTDSTTAQARMDKAQLTVDHTSKELVRVEEAIRRAGQSAARLSDQTTRERERVQHISDTLQQLDFSESAFEALEDQKTELSTSIVPELTEKVRTLQARINGRLKFEYTDPVRGFDRSKVKGTVASLVHVTDVQYTTALEVVAGGKLFQVVVDEAVTGKALLGRGQLKKRCTIIPLDKIQARHVTAPAVQRADQIAQTLHTTAQPAIELVGFDEELRTAMEYVFGASIVAGTKEAAEQICFATKTRVITTEGDIYDPSGTVSGGSKGNFGTTLAQLVELSELTATLTAQQAVLQTVTAQWEALQASKQEYDKLASQLNLAQAQLQATEKHLSQTSFGLLVEQKDAFAADLQQAQDEIAAMTERVAEKQALYERLQAQEGELTQQREKEMRELEQAVQDAKVRVAETTKLAADVESRSQMLTIELENLHKELAAAEEAVRSANVLLNEALQKEAELQTRVEETQVQYEESRTQVQNLEQNFANCSQEVDGIKHEIANLSKLAETAKLEAKKAAVAITRIRKEREGAERTVAAMLNKYTWIEGEQSAFGVSGGDYDFAAADPEAARRQLKELKGEQDNLSKSINKKVMGMIEKAEGEYNELQRKRQIIENDKKTIQKTIDSLDEEKKSELEITWRKVNRDFGSVFSTLLPGARAKLEPPEGMEAWEGLEVKVAFGDEWKESLTELSGGQRSLLALSLILSLLLYKPAPMYILDEVDAALDLSHTQNIGNMLKTHFSQSQFIVVSLKEGMFNNANVIFRTKFVDGVSTVTRTIGTGSSRTSARPRLSAANGIDDDCAMEEDTAVAKNTTARARQPRKRGKENAT